MWAMIPMFRVLSSGETLDTYLPFPAAALLPAVVRERLVRFGHLVGVFLLLERVAAVVVGVEKLAGEALDHGLLGPLPRVTDQPADREGLAPLRTDLDRDLVGGAADPSGFDLDHRLHILDRLFQDRDGVFLRFFLEDVQ